MGTTTNPELRRHVRGHNAAATQTIRALMEAARQPAPPVVEAAAAVEADVEAVTLPDGVVWR